MNQNINQFISLECEVRTHVPTSAAAYYLNRQPQTLRAWACAENGLIRPTRINGRLAWSVALIREILQGEHREIGGKNHGI